MGDFCEMFFEDAELGGQHLELTVTSREVLRTAPMSGFPRISCRAIWAGTGGGL